MTNELTVLGYPAHRSGYVSKANQARCGMIAWKKAGEEMPDYWLRTMIARYMELFYLKRLDGHPAAETLPIVAESWVEDIGYNLTAEVDAERVTRGFMLLSRTAKKWPQPADLLGAMPGRVKGKDEGQRMKDEIIPDAYYETGVAKFQEILNDLGKEPLNED